MSTTVTDEKKDDTTKVVDDDATDTTKVVETATENADDGTGEFDPADYEQCFGLPSGSLKDVKDAESALSIVREYTDKTLIAGLGGFSGGADVPEKTEKKAGTTAEKKPSGNAEYEALRSELDQVKTALQKREQDDNARTMQELERRILAKVDSWQSPKYGVGANRNFKQVQSARELRDLLMTHIAGLQATGGYITQVETLLDRVRVFHDEDYKPTKQAKDAQLGTPGSRKAAKSDKEPRNIHEMLLGNKS